MHAHLKQKVACMLQISQAKKILAVAALLVAGCATSPEQMTKMLEEHPEILTKAIEKNPEVVMGALQKAAQAAQAKQGAAAEAEEEAKFEAEFKTPLKPELDPQRAMLGDAAAPITIVEYTDFECPFCGRGYQTLEKVRETYGAKVRVLVKNLPLPMHPMAVPAARRFEALKLQGGAKAYAFYHEVFKNQKGLKEGEKFLDGVVKKVGGDLVRVKKDMNSDAVVNLIKKDMDEAESFGIQGTPGFIVNGVSIRGAYPFDHFKKIIDRQLAAAK